MLEIPRLATEHDRPALGMVNLASRAERIARFLTALEPTEHDVVFDLGSGCGKFVTTVAASSRAKVIGVELGASWVTSSHETSVRLGVSNAQFVCADVHDVDFSAGTIFYLYHPFHGAIAQHVAGALAHVAARKPVVVYLQGPKHDFVEHFERHLEPGGFTSVERVGPITVLRS